MLLLTAIGLLLLPVLSGVDLDSTKGDPVEFGSVSKISLSRLGLLLPLLLLLSLILPMLLALPALPLI